jgi:branched-chain amino acid transport system permease protein
VSDSSAASSRLRRTGLIKAALFVLALLVLPFVFSQHWELNILIFTLMYAGLASSWNLLGGYAGYASLGHAAFFGVGAYAMAIVLQHINLGTTYGPFLLVPLIGLGTTLAVSPIAWLLLRTRAIVFAVLSITFMFMVQTLAYNLRGLTQGSNGISAPVASFPAATFERPFYYIMAALLALAVLVAWLVQSSKLGLDLNSIRDDEDRARGLGVQTEVTKLIAFNISAGFWAAFGAVWAYYITFIYPGFAIDPLMALGAVLMAFLGGRQSLWGPVLGAALVVPAQQYLAFRYGASHLYLIAYAALFIVVIYLLPRGIVPSASLYLGRLRRRAERSAVPNQAVVDTGLSRGELA